MNSAHITKIAIAALEDMKGINIEILDVTPLTTIADHMIICTGTSNRHVKALADTVMEKAREAGIRPLSSQGLEQGEWALVDLNGTIIHVMQAHARATYQLEKLWDMGQAKPVLNAAKAKKKKSGKKPEAKKAFNKKAAAAKAPAKAAAKPTAKKPLPKKPVTKAGAKPAAKSAMQRPAAKPAAKVVAKPAAKKPLAKKPAATVAVKRPPAKKLAAKKPPAKKPAAKTK